MSDTASLALPLLAAEQAQKHVTMNAALTALDAIVQLAVLDRDVAAPPGAPAEGDRYIVAASPTGAWAGQAGRIAVWQNGAWTFLTPKEGWLAWAADEDAALVHDGTGWGSWSASITALQSLSLLGVGATADATNPFSAKLNKALWTAKTAAEGGDGDLRYTLNKETAADVLSLLLQRGFSGRAELGLIGDDNLTLKVSPDGATWRTALVVDRATGLVSLPLTADLGAIVRVRAATTGNVALSGEQTIDGALTAASVVLVRANTAAAQNGLYVTAAGAWSRLPGFASFDAHPGAIVVVERGAAYADTLWLCTSDRGGTLGTDPIVFAAQNAPLASDTVAGLVELATPAEALNGSLPDRAVPPLALGRFSAFRATRATAVTGIATGAVATGIVCDAEVFDKASDYDPTTGRWTPPAGPVSMKFGYRWNPANMADALRFTSGFLKNGVIAFQVTSAFSGTIHPQGVFVAWEDDANGSDYYQPFVYQQSGATMSVDANANNTQFCGHRIR